MKNIQTIILTAVLLMVANVSAFAHHGEVVEHVKHNLLIYAPAIIALIVGVVWAVRKFRMAKQTSENK